MQLNRNDQVTLRLSQEEKMGAGLLLSGSRLTRADTARFYTYRKGCRVPTHGARERTTHG